MIQMFARSAVVSSSIANRTASRKLSRCLWVPAQSYTGLKPPGRDLGPAIPAADKALETGSDVPLVGLLTGRIQAGLRTHFKEVIEKENFAHTQSGGSLCQLPLHA
jgi:hypothetical protein